MEITEGLVVTIEYTLKDDGGKVLESSDEMGSISFKLGDKRLLPGLANVIRGMTVGEARTGTIAPGELAPRETCPTRRVLLSEFPQGVEPKIGDRFQAKDADARPVMFEVFEKTDDAAQVHILHILHDTEVHYDVKVLAARKANLPPPPPIDVPDLTDDILEDA